MVRTYLYCILFYFLCFNVQSRYIIRDEPLLDETGPYTFNSRSLDQEPLETSQAIKTLTMHGSIAFGYYFTTLYFGTPPQRQTVIVDTGSTITTIPCRECGSSCGVSHLSDFFNPAKSASFQEMSCKEHFGNYVCNNCNDMCSFDIRYSEGSSYHGRYKKDYISFDGPNVTSNPTLLRGSHTQDDEQYKQKLEEATNNITNRMFIPFGCTLKETNLFLTQEADGILGLGVDTNSFKTPPNIFDSLHMANSSITNAFSICMGQIGGYLAVGGYNSTYHEPTEDIQYMPYDGRNGQYRVYWKDVKFEGESLNIAENVLNEDKGAYIDSGTTLLYTTYFIARTINEALGTFCRKEGNCGGNIKEDICWIYDPEKYPTVEEFYATFGTFTFHFGQNGESEYEWRPEDYLFHYSPATNYYCLSVDRVNGKKTLFGGAFMKNHDVLFDKDNHRIGFIRADCSAEYDPADYPKYMRSAQPEELIPTSVLKILLIVLIAATLIFLGIHVLMRYLQTRKEKNKFTNVELGMSIETHQEEGLEAADTDFKILTEEDNQKLKPLSEHYAV